MSVELFSGDCLEVLRGMESCSVDCIVTSPPYNKKGLLGRVSKGNQVWGKFEIDYKSYGDDMGEVEYQSWQVEVINECVRVLKEDGSLFYNHKPRRHQNVAHLPFEFISKSEAKLYQLIIWNRKNSPNLRNDCLVPCTEHVYWLVKGKPKVYRSQVDERFRGEVWEIVPGRQKDHPAPFPEQLVENCVKLTTQEGDVVLDPFMGSGTTGVVAKRLGRDVIGIEMDSSYIEITEQRLKLGVLPL